MKTVIDCISININNIKRPTDKKDKYDLDANIYDFNGECLACSCNDILTPEGYAKTFDSYKEAINNAVEWVQTKLKEIEEDDKNEGT